jgi:hypothetical protein
MKLTTAQKIIGVASLLAGGPVFAKSTAKSVTAGWASFKHGDQSVKLQVDRMCGLSTAGTLNFLGCIFAEGKTTLKLEFSFAKTGPVKNINEVQARDEIGISSASSRLGKCNLTVVDFTPTSLDVKGSCTKTDDGGGRKPGRPIKDIQVHIETP